MVDEPSKTYRGYLFDLVKTSLYHQPYWRGIEADVLLACSNIPLNVTTREKKEQLIAILKEMRSKVLSAGATPGDVAFLADEITRYEETSQITLYNAKDDQLDSDVIKKYASMGFGTEGIVGIPQTFNYKQLSELTNGIFRLTGLVKFFISREKTMYGKIASEMFEFPQTIPVAMLAHSKAINEEGFPRMKRIILFGERYDSKKFVVTKEIPAKMRVYRFISEENLEYIVFSTEGIPCGDYVITGVETECNDSKQLTDSAKLPTKLPFFFAQEVKNRIIRYTGHEEFKARLVTLDVPNKNFFDFPFTTTVPNDGKQYILKQPKWFKWLVWGWLCHARKGVINAYPMHLFIVGPKGSGKSVLQNSLWAKSKEARAVFSGNGSTIKSILPSFYKNPPQIGYLCESNRFAFLDEFLATVTRTKGANENSHGEDELVGMNDLLEHQLREFGSGVSRLRTQMTARALMCANPPPRTVHSVEDLLNYMPESLASRVVIYWQSEDGEQIKMIRESGGDGLQPYDFSMSDNDWVSILDYLWTFHSKYDMKRVDEIYRRPLEYLSVKMRMHYEARHKHHIECLMDGIIKARCIQTASIDFSAGERDYDTLEDVWHNLVSSWCDPQRVIRALPVEKRQKYLPEVASFLFSLIAKQKRAMTSGEVKKLVEFEMTNDEFIKAFVILRDNDLITDHDGIVRPYFLDRQQGDEA